MDDKRGTSATRAKNKYKNKAYDRLEIVVPKGKKEEIQDYAKSQGKSLNGFVNDAIDKEMGATQPAPTTPAPSTTQAEPADTDTKQDAMDKFLEERRKKD